MNARNTGQRRPVGWRSNSLTMHFMVPGSSDLTTVPILTNAPTRTNGPALTGRDALLTGQRIPPPNAALQYRRDTDVIPTQYRSPK